MTKLFFLRAWGITILRRILGIFYFFRAQFASFLLCDLQINYKTLSRFFMLFFPSFYRNNVCQKEKEQNKTLIPCLPLNPARGNRSQSLREFLDFMLIFFTSDGQFLACATKVISDFPCRLILSTTAHFHLKR